VSRAQLCQVCWSDVAVAGLVAPGAVWSLRAAGLVATGRRAMRVCPFSQHRIGVKATIVRVEHVLAALAVTAALFVPAPAPPLAPSGCTPLTNGGKCYEPGELCRKSDHGASGVAGDGENIVCQNNDGWRWEPAS